MRIAMLAFLGALAGCGTIVNGRRQGVAITSTPSGVECEADGKKFTTPAVVKMNRSRPHLINCTAPGHAPAGAAVTRSGSGWVFGNLMLGGPVGLLVDWASGGLYKLEPPAVNVTLAEAK